MNTIPRQPFLASLVLTLLTIVPALPQDPPLKALTAAQVREELAYTIGVQAYIYGYPMVEMYRVRHARVFDPANKNRGSLNQFQHRRKLADPSDTTVVFPNNDTLYSSAWLDLSKEPLVMHVPDTADRYYVFQFMDFYTNNFAYLGKRTTGSAEGNFLITGPGWKGKPPSEFQLIESPTTAVWVLGRTVVNGKADLPAVHALQDLFTLKPLSARRGKDTPAPAEPKPDPPPYDPAEPLRFFEYLNAGLHENPPQPREAALMGLFRQIGVGPRGNFRVADLDPASAKGLRRALAMGPQLINVLPGPEPEEKGWSAPLSTAGKFGDNYLARARVAKAGLAALSPAEAIYYRNDVDSQQRQLTGGHKYLLRFEKGQFPPVKAFWSVAMYRSPEGFFVANPLERYSVGDRTKELRYGDDGSLELLIQHESPGKDKESSWLPAPRGDFYLGLRCYVPDKEILEGKWKAPAVKRVE